ncbi:MAG: hypothetical protein AB7S78_06920 [Candidatus Omnitrophota bacterium]
MNRFDFSTSPYIDQVVSNIRTQIINLHNCLETIERTHRYDDGFILESLKESETELRRLRRRISQS